MSLPSSAHFMKEIRESLSRKRDTFARLSQDSRVIDAIDRVAKLIIEAFGDGNRLMLCGNGGSAADAQHIAAEFTGRFMLERKALRAEALGTNFSALTAISNDYGFEYMFSRQLEATGKKGDVLIGLSTSGKSKNVLRAFDKAKEMGINTVLLTGSDEPEYRPDILIKAPTHLTAGIQECHIAIGHIICEIVENALFSTGPQHQEPPS